MLGEYSIMDWVTLAGIASVISSVVGILVKMSVDKQVLLAEFKILSKENDALKKEIASLSKEHSGLSKEHKDIKEDTEYLVDEMKLEKMARENLYKNTSQAKEILETMDIMQEIVLKNAELNAKVSSLDTEVAELQMENQQLLKSKKDNKEVIKLGGKIHQFSQQLAKFEDFRETEAIRATLKRIENDLSEY